jgi:hypothetical protein
MRPASASISRGSLRTSGAAKLGKAVEARDAALVIAVGLGSLGGTGGGIGVAVAGGGVGLGEGPDRDGDVTAAVGASVGMAGVDAAVSNVMTDSDVSTCGVPKPGPAQLASTSEAAARRIVDVCRSRSIGCIVPSNGGFARIGAGSALWQRRLRSLATGGTAV